MLGPDTVLYLRQGVVLERNEEQSYLYDLDTQSYALLDNDVAIAIARQCDGVKSVAMICDEISRLYDATPEHIQQDVSAMLTTLLDARFLSLVPIDAQAG